MKDYKRIANSSKFTLVGSLFLSLTLLALEPAKEQEKVPAVKPADPELGKGAEAVPSGRDLVNMDFPELTEIKDIIKAVALWTGKNVILDRNVTGKVQIISPKKVTKEEAYQAFLSALNMLQLTTVETGKVIKIMKVRNAVKGNLKTFLGSSWAPRTDEIITQIVPLKYIDAKQIQTTLTRIVSSSSMIAYEPTNTLIISDSGYNVRRVLEILELIDVQTQQPKVVMVPIKYSDPNVIAKQVSEILKSSASGTKSLHSNYNTFKLMVDDRTNSVIIFGPPRTIKDIRDLVQKFDVRLDDPSSQATIHVRPLDYADAKKLSTTLSALSAGSKTEGARRSPLSKEAKNANPTVALLNDGLKITADESTNSLLVTGSKNAYDALNSIIRKLDVRRAQVFIEADILDLNEGNDLNFGTSIFGGAQRGASIVGGWEAANMGPFVVAQALASSNQTPAQTTVQGITSAFANNMTIGLLSSKTVNVPGINKSVTPGLLINLLKEDRNTKVISSPHILTSNNSEATIAVGDTIFFRSASQANPATGTQVAKVEKEKVEMTLTIKPNVSYSNYITFDLSLEQNSPKGQTADGLPLISTRKTKQNVTVKNGQTVVVSGLIRNQEIESFKKMPLLGDIPILGWLFRNSVTKKERSNLVVFLTPHIIHSASDLAAIYKSKIAERDEFFGDVFGKSKDSAFYKMLPKEEDGMYRPDQRDLLETERLKKYEEESLNAMGYDLNGSELDTAKENPMQNDVETTIPQGAKIDNSGGGFSQDLGGGENREPEIPSPPPPIEEHEPPPPPDEGDAHVDSEQNNDNNDDEPND